MREIMNMEFSHDDLNRTLWVKPWYLEKNRERYQIDATGLTLWKIAVMATNYLTWKWKTHSCNFWDCGDFVVVNNVDKMKFTWNKLFDKMYYRYSWYKGNLKSSSLEEMMAKTPDRVLWTAVKGMLPKNKMRKRRLKRLKMSSWVSDKYNYLNPEVVS